MLPPCSKAWCPVLNTFHSLWIVNHPLLLHWMTVGCGWMFLYKFNAEWEVDMNKLISMKSLRAHNRVVCRGEQSYKISDLLLGSCGFSLTQLSQTDTKRRTAALPWGYPEQMEAVPSQWIRWVRGGKADFRRWRNSAAVPPMLACCFMQRQIQALAKNAVQQSTWAEPECCFKCQKSHTARLFVQHLCRMKWPWLLCHEDLTKLTHPLQWTVSSEGKWWREKFVFFNKSVCISWSKKAGLGQLWFMSMTNKGTNLSLSNILVGMAQMIHFQMSAVLQWKLKDWGRTWVLKINCEELQLLGLPFFRL